MKKTNTQKNMSNIKKTGLAVATSAVVGAGIYYFLGSKDAKKHRAQVSTWMKKAEKEIASKVKKLKDDTLNEKNFKTIISEVAEKYRTLHNLEEKEAKQFMATLKKAWKSIKKNKGKLLKNAGNRNNRK